MSKLGEDRPDNPLVAALSLHAVKLAASGIAAAENEALLAARDARDAGASTARIADALGWSRATLWRRMRGVGYW